MWTSCDFYCRSTSAATSKMHIDHNSSCRYRIVPMELRAIDCRMNSGRSVLHKLGYVCDINGQVHAVEMSCKRRRQKGGIVIIKAVY